MATCHHRQHQGDPPGYGWVGPSHSVDTADTSVANNTSSASGRSATGTVTGATHLSLAPSTTSHHLDHGRSGYNGSRGYDASDVGQTAGCTSDLLSLWNNALVAFPQANAAVGNCRGVGGSGAGAGAGGAGSRGGARGGKGGGRDGTTRTMQPIRGPARGQSILDYVTGCSGGRYDATVATINEECEEDQEEDQEGEDDIIPAYRDLDRFDSGMGYNHGRTNIHQRGGSSSSSRSSKNRPPRERSDLSDQGYEVDQFGTARTAGTKYQGGSRMTTTPKKTKNKKKGVTIRELAAGAGAAGAGAGAGAGVNHGAGIGGTDSSSTPSPRGVTDYRDVHHNQNQRGKLREQGQPYNMNAAEEVDAILEGQQQQQLGEERTLAARAAAGTAVAAKARPKHPVGTNTTTTTTTGGNIRARFNKMRGKGKGKTGDSNAPRSAKYRLAETQFDTGGPVSVDVGDESSVDSFLNVEMLDTNPAAELVDASGKYRHRSSIVADADLKKKKDALGRYRHYDSIKIGGIGATSAAAGDAGGGGGAGGGALADDLSDILDVSAEEENAMTQQQRQLYHHQRVRTLGRVYQQQQKEQQLQKKQPHDHQQHPQHNNLDRSFERSSTAPPTPKARPSLARVTSGDEYDDNTAVEEMRMMADIYQRGQYANAELPPPREDTKKKSKGDDEEKAPLEDVELTRQLVVDLKRTVSELTMRSSYGELMDGIDPNRRMAYYAVGKDPGTTGGKKRPGGNRRCYFTGRVIVGRNPFYAGTVQQGLRTLVVFCLPSAIGFPKQADIDAVKRAMNETTLRSIEGLHNRENSGLTSFITEETDPDPNEETPPEILLAALPEPDKAVMKTISDTYSEQYETLPAQVQDPSSWKLYEMFCHFSGLPIAVGEVHYRVRPQVIIKSKLAKKLERKFGKSGRKSSDSTILSPSDEIILSHEVMLACNGEESSEIIRLPNTRCFRYLKKHYPHQCSKLADDVFDRSSWEMVKPEV